MTTKNELLFKAESLGLKVSRNARKWEIEKLIENHLSFIELNKKMANRPRKELF